MNNYYYGKSGKGDYRKDDLPRTRWQLFWEMLRVRLAGLFRLNLMTFVLWLPTMLVLAQLVSGLLNLAGVLSIVEADRAAATPQEVEVYENYLPLLNAMVFQSLLYLVPCILITGPAQAGLAYVTRNWARDEHAFAWSDFKDAVKENWKQALGISAITSVLPLLLYVGYRFYGQMSGNSSLFIVPQMLMVLLGVLWSLALVYFYPLMVTYRLSFGTLIKNGFLLAIGRLPHTVGVRLVMLVPTLIVLAIIFLAPVYSMYALMGLAGWYVLIGNALARFVYASLANAVFDRFINRNIPGVEVDRGMAQPDDLDDDAWDAPETSGQLPDTEA